jgi:hypothetical protein
MRKNLIIALALMCLLPALAQEATDDSYRYQPENSGRVLHRVEDADGVRYVVDYCGRTVSQGIVCLFRSIVQFDASKGKPLPDPIWARPGPVDMTFCGRARTINAYSHDIHLSFFNTGPHGENAVFFACNTETPGMRALIWWGFPEDAQLTSSNPAEEERRFNRYFPKQNTVSPIQGNR